MKGIKKKKKTKNRKEKKAIAAKVLKESAQEDSSITIEQPVIKLMFVRFFFWLTTLQSKNVEPVDETSAEDTRTEAEKHFEEVRRQRVLVLCR